MKVAGKRMTLNIWELLENVIDINVICIWFLMKNIIKSNTLFSINSIHVIRGTKKFKGSI